MLTPEDIKELKPHFEEIHRHLNVALIKSGVDIPADAAVHYIESLALMEDLVDEVTQKEGHSVKEAFMRVVDPSAEKAGLVGGLTSAAASLSSTVLGGFGIAAGRTADGKGHKPHFEQIHRHLNIALIKSGADIPDAAAGRYVASLLLMEELVDEFTQKEGRSVKEAFMRVVDPSAEKAGLVGGLGAAAASLSFTGLGGFGIAAGGTAVGVAGLTGAAVATGGTALAGGAALYLAYKGGSMALETEVGQKVAEQAADTGRKSVEQAKVVGKRTKEGISRIRNMRIRFDI